MRELTGVSRLPTYDDDLSAMTIIDEHGSLKDAVTHFMEAYPVPKSDLEPGDIALVTIYDEESIGVLMDNGNIAIVFEDHGLREIRPDFCDEGWRVWG